MIAPSAAGRLPPSEKFSSNTWKIRRWCRPRPQDRHAHPLRTEGSAPTASSTVAALRTLQAGCIIVDFAPHDLDRSPRGEYAAAPSPGITTSADALYPGGGQAPRVEFTPRSRWWAKNTWPRCSGPFFVLCLTDEIVTRMRAEAAPAPPPGWRRSSRATPRPSSTPTNADLDRPRHLVGRNH